MFLDVFKYKVVCFMRQLSLERLNDILRCFAK